MIRLTRDRICHEELLSRVRSPGAGAEVLFLGTTRQFTGDRQTAALYYECYEEMALTQLAELEAEARRRWALIGCQIAHRCGTLLPGETSVAIAVSAAHRQAAFEAAEWIIDRIKEVVPIWKQEQWSDGSSDWVHPGLPPD